MRIPKCFTMIERLVVMSGLALRLTIALPQYFRSLGKSKDVALQENLRILRVVIDQFHADKGRFPATLQELVDEKDLREIRVDPVTQSSASWILTPARNRDDSGVEDVRSGAPGSSQDGVAEGCMLARCADPLRRVQLSLAAATARVHRCGAVRCCTASCNGRSKAVRTGAIGDRVAVPHGSGSLP